MPKMRPFGSIKARLLTSLLIIPLLWSSLLVSGFINLPVAEAAAAGSITGWGNNNVGQVNIPDGLGNATAISAGGSHSLALRSDGTVIAWGDNSAGQLNIPTGLNNVSAISAGGYHSLALKSNGTVIAWGGSGTHNLGQANVPPGLNNVIAVSAGLLYSLALKSDGTLVAWGDNSTGQRNFPVGLNNVIAISAGSNHGLALKSDGTVVAWGDNSKGQRDVPSGLNNVTAISAGGNHSLALKGDGTVVAWGDNTAGQISAPSGLNNVIAISAGGAFNLALRGDGTVSTWGDNSKGQRNVPSGLDNVTLIAAGDDFSLALKSDNTLVTGWGDNSDGELSIPAGLSNVKAVSAGSFNSLALKSNGTVLAWGAGGSTNAGQNNIPAGLNNVIAISAPGYSHNYALKSNGNVVGWGDNTFGQLNFPSGLNNVKAVSAGNYQGLALKSDGTVSTWGDNSEGETNIPPGLNNIKAISMGEAHSAAIKGDGTVIAWGNNVFGQTNVPAGLNNVVAISAGGTHTLALKADGTVVAWGDNSAGQLNVPSGLNNVIAVAGGGDFSAALKADGTVVAWGTDYYGETDVPAGLNNVTAISGGAAFSLALYAADLIPPTTTATTTPASPNGANGWFTSDVTVRLTVTDNTGGSGAKNVYYSLSGAQNQAGGFVNAATTSFTIRTNGITTVTYYGTDNNGNAGDPQTLTIKLDKLSPTVTATPDRTANTNGWYNAPVTYSFSGVDNTSGSGGVTCDTPKTYSGPDSATASLIGNCTDAAGNVGSITVNLKYDATKPTISASARKADGTAYTAGTWTNQNVTVSFSCNDTTSGIASGACPSPTTVSASGITPSVSGTVSDQAGNSSNSTTFGPIWIDKTAPSVTATPDRAPDNNGWYNAPVNFSFSGVDDTGGSGGVSCEATKTYSGPDSATASVKGTCTDAAGNVGSVTANLKYDATKPTISASAKKADGTAYTAGTWTNQNVTVSFSCNDVTSGIASGACPADQIFGNEGSSTANGTVSDQAGNSNSASFGPILIDKTAPTVTATPDRAPDSNSWYNKPVTFSFSGVDNAGGSGGVTCDTARTYSGPDSDSASITGTCTDAAGNVGSTTPVFQYDATKPTITASAKTADGKPYTAGTWTNQNVIVSFSCNDATSGLSGSCPPDQTFSSEGSFTGNGSVSDQAGNISSTSFGPVKIDRTKPTADPAPAPVANSNGWNKTDVTISWNWSDNSGGSGIDAANCTTSSTSSGEGVLTLNASCQDLAGNTNSASYTVKVDKTAPVVTATPDRAANANGWYNAPVTFTFSGNDGSGSGVVKCDPAQTYNGSDSATASVTGTCIDKAGNVGSATATLKYDATTPTITYTGNAGTYTLDQTVSITCKPSDNLSGIASSTCANITGPAYTFAAGTNTFSASATDKAGNIGTGSTTFTVGVTYDDLCTLSAKFSTDPNVDKGLCDKLVAAKAAAARGDLTAKNNILDAYRQQVAAQTGKALTADQAAILTRLSRAF